MTTITRYMFCKDVGWPKIRVWEEKTEEPETDEDWQILEDEQTQEFFEALDAYKKFVGEPHRMDKR